jgi:AcrR family transcriptional regulator
VSRADGATRILEAAVRLGSASGVSALSVQGVADAAEVSKALVLYHFDSKAALITGLVGTLGTRSTERLHAAARGRDVEAAWRALVSEETRTRELALFGALILEPDVPVARVEAAMATRVEGATALVVALLARFGLTPRIPPVFAGRMLLRELDAFVVASARTTPTDSAGAAEQDAMLLALLAVGR